MAIAPLNGLVLKDVTLDIDGTDYRFHASAVTFTPAASTITWTGLGQNTITDVSTATWTLALTYLQDWSTTGLSTFLYNSESETVPVTFIPKDGGPSFTANVLITPGSIGGAVNAFAESTVTLGVTGKPVLVPAA